MRAGGLPLVKDRPAVILLVLHQKGLHVIDRPAPLRLRQAGQVALAIEDHVAVPGLRLHAIEHVIGRATGRAVRPAQMRGVADMGQGMQALGGIGHDRQERPVHDRHAIAFQLRRRGHQGDLGQFMLDVGLRQAAGSQHGIQLGVGDVEDVAGVDLLAGGQPGHRAVGAILDHLDPCRQPDINVQGVEPVGHVGPQHRVVEGVLIAGEGGLDHRRIEQGRLGRIGRGDGRAHVAEHAEEAVGRHLRTSPGDGVEHLEIVDDRFWKVAGKAAVQDHRLGGGQGAARIVEAGVNTRLVDPRRPAQQLVAGLDQDDAVRHRAQEQGQAAAIEAAADHQIVDLPPSRHAPPMRRSASTSTFSSCIT